MPKRSGNGKESNHFAQPKSDVTNFVPNHNAIFRDGQLDTDAYFRFLENYWAFMAEQGLRQKKREPIIIKDRKF